ncbi:hypothetical protein AB205_0054010 [Aquarana catesbeiana]|uniref:Uncharacterized protein n=1 Tax=Aquarana catesbeiana TaxID=8400 RepID=A0A2G9SJH2_AQUCT|nr:hypothetical protein AB205_0054010 [Aquarana catesbeiana]
MIQECSAYRVQDSGVLCVQSAGFRSMLHTECRIQEYSAYRVQGSGACCLQSAGFRSALHTVCRVQEHAAYRVPGLEACCVEGAGFRSVLHTEVQGSGARCVQSAGFRSVLCRACRVQEHAAYRVQGSGACFAQCATSYFHPSSWLLTSTSHSSHSTTSTHLFLHSPQKASGFSQLEKKKHSRPAQHSCQWWSFLTAMPGSAHKKLAPLKGLRRRESGRRIFLPPWNRRAAHALNTSRRCSRD